LAEKRCRILQPFIAVFAPFIRRFPPVFYRFHGFHGFSPFFTINIFSR
jgi:hypothetical protein